MTDTQLIELLTSEDNGLRNKGFSYLVERDYEPVLSYVKRNSGNPEDAKDIFQEGLIALIRNIHNQSFRKTSSLKSYLYSICKNLWLQELRKMNRNTAEIETSTSEHDLERNLASEFDEKLQVVRDKFNTLGEECQKILVLFYYKKKSMKYLQELYQLGSTQAAKNKKSRCLKKLSSLVE